MADLSIDFAGIRSPNPFWLASAPPTDKGYTVRRAFEAGHGGVDVRGGHRRRRGRLVPGSALCGHGGRHRVRLALLALSLLAAPAVADIRAGGWCDPSPGPTLFVGRGGDASPTLGWGEHAFCEWIAPPHEQAHALAGTARCTSHGLYEGALHPIEARDVEITLVAFSSDILLAAIDGNPPATYVWCGF